MSILLKRVWTEGTPLINGDKVTFVWYGDDPPVLRGDFNDWDETSAPEWHLHKSTTDVGGTAALPVWFTQMTLPVDAYLEYCFGPDDARVADPFNKRRVPNGFGDYNNYFYMPEASPTGLVRRRRRGLRGIVSRHDVPTDGLAAGKKRRVYLYQPPVTHRCPLLVVLDGSDYRRWVKLTTMADNLVSDRRMTAVALAMVGSGGSRSRMIEYACSESTLLFLTEKVLPLAQGHLNLTDVAKQPGAYGILGASLGGLMALFTAVRLPHLFGRVISQSGTFCFDAYPSLVYDLVQYGDVKPLRIWMDVGRFEESLEPNRRMARQLRDRGYDVIYREYSGGHNYRAWRDDLWRGLEALFPWIES